VVGHIAYSALDDQGACSRRDAAFTGANSAARSRLRVAPTIFSSQAAGPRLCEPAPGIL